MSQRSFGSDIGNTTTAGKKEMTASNASADDSLVKHTQLVKKDTEQMEIAENGDKAILRLPKPLAIEVYSKIHNSTLSKDDILDEIEDLVDEKYFVGEKLMSAGKEYVVVSSEKRGGLTMYTMEDGSKIGHRDLKRKKGFSVDEIKQIAIEDVELHDGKIWKVKDALLKECPIRETIKFAPIFSSANRRASGVPTNQATPTKTTDTVTLDDSSDDEEEEDGTDGVKEEEQKRNNGSTPVRRSGAGSAPRASGGPATTASRRLLEKKKEKEAKDKEKAEKKQKELEEKQKKKEEEKAKKQAEKDEKQAKREEKAARKSLKNGTMDAFVKKENGQGSSSSNGENVALFSPSKWGEKRTALGFKKVDEAWKKRDQEAFNEACAWCEKNLSQNQRASIDNPTYRFAIQKLIDKTKDKATMKGMAWTKKAEYKEEKAKERKAIYSKFEPQIKAWFSEDIALDDLLVTSEHLALSADSKQPNCNEEFLKCMEIAQYFVSMRKILLWNDNISAQQLREDLHLGFDGFQRSTYKMIANLLETALQEKEHEKTAHCNARLSEFPITEYTITEMTRAFFVGNVEMSYKRDSKQKVGGAEEEEEEMDSEEKAVEDEQQPETSENGRRRLEEEQEEESDSEDEADNEQVAQKARILALFTGPQHIYEWAPGAQLELLYALKEVVHGLPIIREWYLRDANSDQLNKLKVEAAKIAKKIETYQQQLSDLPTFEVTDEMSRTQTREQEKTTRRRQQLEAQLDDLKDDLEENREAAAREHDDLERIFRVVSIGNDRHLRKYYWFAYSSDAGIWVQDFGTTSYEKWVSECREKGFMDVESHDVADRPEYEDLPLTSAQCTETWYKLDTEPAVRHLISLLKKNGKREKMLKKYISNNLEDILSSIKKRVKKEEEEEDDVEMEEEAESKEAEPEEGTVDEKKEEIEEEKGAELPEKNRFTGPFASLKLTMMELLADWQLSGITKIVDTAGFEAKLQSVDGLEEMKVLVIELATSIPESCLIEKFPQNEAIAKKCFSHLKIHRFRNRVNEATNASCLHMLLAYYDARIDQQKTLTEMPCQVCRRKHGNRKLLCRQCATAYHIQCHRPTISAAMYEEEGFKEGWWCAKCVKEERRRQVQKANAEKEEREKEGRDSNRSDSDSDEEVVEEEWEEEPRGRSAKRKANAAMRDVMEFQGELKMHAAPPPPKRHKKTVKPEVQEMFNSIEKANPRLYKLLLQVPSQSRSTRNSHLETRSLAEIEDDLDVYKSTEQLHAHLTQFFQQARGYVETHNPRKSDDLDILISELGFI